MSKSTRDLFRAAYFLSLAAVAASVAYLELQKIHWPLDDTSAMRVLVVVLSAMSAVCFVGLSTA